MTIFLSLVTNQSAKGSFVSGTKHRWRTRGATDLLSRHHLAGLVFFFSYTYLSGCNSDRMVWAALSLCLTSK
jgi:hypothetical protein